MRSGQRTPSIPVIATALLLTAAACTGAPAQPEPSPSSSPQPPPTSYAGEAPPGLAERPLRFLHGADSPAQEILDDPRGVRTQAVGDAFLISSNSEERHLLQGAAEGRVRWEGTSRIERFTSDGTGAEVFEVSTGDAERPTRTVVDQTGEAVWTGTDPRETYLNGLSVRAPADWSASDPYGEFVLRDVDGDAEWSYQFAEPADENGGEEEEEGDEPLGVPVAAHGDVVLLDDGAGTLRAHHLPEDGEPLWSASGADVEFDDERALSTPRPHLVGFYPLPAAKDGTAAEEPPDADVEESPDPDEPETRQTALVRWISPEERSLLSLYDLRDGTMLWSLREPGANPANSAFLTTPVTGTVWDAASRTLLLPQTDAATPVVAVDLVTGDVRWEFAEDEERSITPRFALSGYVYGDTRYDGGTAQVVLEAETKDLVTDDLPGYVEAMTADGHALVVQDHQRFVFAPKTPPEAGTPPTRPATTQSE